MTQGVEREGGGSNYSRTSIEVLLPGHFWWSPNGTYTGEQISSSSWTIERDFMSTTRTIQEARAILIRASWT